MTHDPLCPSLGHGALPLIDLCRCGLIAKVREDEQMKEYNRPFDEVSMLWFKRGYAAALRDIHAEVLNMPPTLGPYIHGFGTVLLARDRVLKAIEVLRGER